MRILLTKYSNTVPTIIIVHLMLFPLCLLFLVLLDVSTVSLCVFYFCGLIGKLISCRVWRQVVRWGGTNVWCLTSGCRQTWRQSIFFFFMEGVHFFCKKNGEKNLFHLKSGSLGGNGASVRTRQWDSQNRHDRHTDSRFRLFEGNSPRDTRGL